MRIARSERHTPSPYYHNAQTVQDVAMRRARKHASKAPQLVPVVLCRFRVWDVKSMRQCSSNHCKKAIWAIPFVLPPDSTRCLTVGGSLTCVACCCCASMGIAWVVLLVLLLFLSDNETIVLRGPVAGCRK